MRGANKIAMRDKAFINFLCAWVVPPALIAAAFYLNWTITGLVLLGIYSLLIVWGLAAKAVIGIKRMLGQEVPKSASDIATNILWEMCRVWDELEGPTVNPAMLREALLRSRDKGACGTRPSIQS